ncbi:MAG: hypothetical protein Q8L60_08015 [Gammaproteobacteria bacterium]|nr:hypothetical protein [Gammaproteobacteria bacterium]MDP2140088.1 hypothetical protein [Gammaproteobacteria bacterium]MDP2347650.1 hypothetical protein [Gammaproteobacteria bacterium]
MRKKTRSVVSGLLIAVASLVALGYAYEEARINMLRFFVGSLAMILIVLAFAALAVTALALLRRLGKLLGKKSADNGDDFPSD